MTKTKTPLAANYQFDGQTYTVEDFLNRQRIMGLVIPKGDSIILEAYQYGRTAADKFASMSMA